MFVELLISVVADVQRAGEIARYLGRHVPILIHELEYDDAIADENARANPPELVEAAIGFPTRRSARENCVQIASKIAGNRVVSRGLAWTRHCPQAGTVPRQSQ